jgi:hypothetical protein
MLLRENLKASVLLLATRRADFAGNEENTCLHHNLLKLVRRCLAVVTLSGLLELNPLRATNATLQAVDVVRLRNVQNQKLRTFEA